MEHMRSTVVLRCYGLHWSISQFLPVPGNDLRKTRHDIRNFSFPLHKSINGSKKQIKEKNGRERETDRQTDRERKKYIQTDRQRETKTEK